MSKVLLSPKGASHVESHRNGGAGLEVPASVDPPVLRAPLHRNRPFALDGYDPGRARQRRGHRGRRCRRPRTGPDARVLLSSHHLGGSCSKGDPGSEPAIEVPIDILPGEDANVVDLDAMRTVPVAILSRPGFDPSVVDPRTIVLAGAAVVKQGDGAIGIYEDLNGDGVPDLVVQVAAGSLSIGETPGQATLQAATFDGRPVLGDGGDHPLCGPDGNLDRDLRAKPDPGEKACC